MWMSWRPWARRRPCRRTVRTRWPRRNPSAGSLRGAANPPPEKLICVGVNFPDRNAEYRDGQEAPANMSLFVRFPRSFTGHGQPLIRPPESPQLDYEGEVTIVIGKGGRRIAEAGCPEVCAREGILHPPGEADAAQIRRRHLQALAPEVIVSANIGCITHLQSGTATPVRHWVELLDDALHAGA